MINIIIPTTFDPTLTYGLLDSMKKFDMGAEYHVTVVDNGSDPIFDYKDDKVTIIREDQRLSFAKAMNIGITATQDSHVLLLNNDTLIQHDNFLGNLLETLTSQEEIGIVAPMTNFICVPSMKIPNKESLPNKVWENPGHIAAVCFLMKKATIDDIGMFDENFNNSHDDGDFCERLLRKKYKIMIDGRCFLFHYGSRTVCKTPGYVESFSKNSAYYKKKWEIK